MLAYTYLAPGTFALKEKPLPQLIHPRDAIVQVTLSSICTSDLHIKHGMVPHAVPGITLGHEMVGIVHQVGRDITNVKPGDRVAVNVETFCGHCFFCRQGYVNNCTDPNGGWALGCRIDGGQAEYVRVPYADQGLTRIPDQVSDRQALFVGDLLSTGLWAADLSHVGPEDTVLLLGAGPTGICTLLCLLLKNPKQIIVCEQDPQRRTFVQAHFPQVLTVPPDEALPLCQSIGDHGGADAVIDAAGGTDTFSLSWQCARPNAIVVLVAMYEKPQVLPLPEMYGKNLIFKTGGVDACQCQKLLSLIQAGKLDTTPLITHTFPLSKIDSAYDLFEHRQEGVMKVAIQGK